MRTHFVTCSFANQFSQVCLQLQLSCSHAFAVSYIANPIPLPTPNCLIMIYIKYTQNAQKGNKLCRFCIWGHQVYFAYFKVTYFQELPSKKGKELSILYILVTYFQSLLVEVTVFLYLLFSMLAYERCERWPFLLNMWRLRI